MRGVSLKADYLYAHRIPRAYLTQPLQFNPNLGAGLPGGGGPGWEVTLAQVASRQLIRGLPLEFNQLRRYDEADRVRKDAVVTLDVTRSEKVNYSVSYRYLRDDYDKDFYGLHYYAQSSLNAEITYFPGPAQQDDSATSQGSWKENTFIYANYTRDQEQTGYRSLGSLIIGATANVRACCAQYPIANTWDRSSRINLDMFQFGLNTSSAGERTIFDLSYALAFAKDRTHTANPFPILAVSLRTAGAYNYLDVINRQQETNVSVTHQLRAGLALGFSYRFEPYRLDDYYTNNLQPYSPRQPAATVANAQTARYLFLDARFTTYHAHVATVFLRYSF